MEHKSSWHAIVIGSFLVLASGLSALALERYLKSHIVDPLLVGMLIGIFVRSIIKFDSHVGDFLWRLPMFLIPIGVIFYGFSNLNFVEFAHVEADLSLTLLIGFLVYIGTALGLSNVFRIRDKTGYLIATGSAICGASAIAITSRSIDANPEEVSTSLISVFISAIIGLFVVLPLVGRLAGLSPKDYAVLCGSTLQFTGFVKASMASMAPPVAKIAISIKAMRYLGLFFAIPIFASFVKGKISVPWFIYAFLAAGLCGSLIPQISVYKPVSSLSLTILWTFAMAAVGLNGNIRALFSREGAKVFLVSLLSFFAAVCVVLLEIKFL